MLEAQFSSGCPAGLLLVDKPKDWSSHDIINVARRFLGLRKIGHAGTLDPMATGLLILLVGRAATKLQSRFLKLDKEYTGVITLGVETDSWDAYGNIVSEAAPPVFETENIIRAAQKLTGTFEHPVPFYSAKKVAGRPMHRRVREGETMEQKHCPVTVHEWRDIKYNHPDINFTVRVSSGTYVRSLAFMTGEILGTKAHLSALRRTKTAEYDVKDAVTVDFLRSAPQAEIFKKIMQV
ncbi:MAG: tRNA pseudouridine(55) synthase TruB [Elusimicrobium sp.]|jgi:tRNA pseudouridine55 synthase|nr:tRNA pseudouridine(55) synthase TruB [Elusimicrobium sp.]